MFHLLGKGMLSLGVLTMFAGLAFAKTPRYVEGQVIVKLAGVETIQDAATYIDTKQFDIEKLVPSMGLFLLKMKNSRMTVESALNNLLFFDGVTYAQADHKVSLREEETPPAEMMIPNDTDFKKQWSLFNPDTKADISAPLAWTLGTGGKNFEEQDIVVAIVDGGVDAEHKDLKENMWVNKGEIAGNNIDDDENGYVDDIHGWNAYSNNGTINADFHGTHVAGIAGARGNNENQVVGVNWNVKIMAIAGASSSTSTVLKAYGYALKQKQLWLESDGEKGANVVATNSSFGIDFAKCDTGSYPSWNDIYNEMGEVGILSAAATANRNVDIDKVGDVPTGCASDFIISVTNTDKEDKKNTRAAYGLTQVDLGAPGTQVLSTYPGNQTRALTGTSMATPHVAGAVAFLHSVASEDLGKLMKDNPARANLTIKNILLDNVDANETLKDKTVTGGRLNLFKAAKAAATFQAPEGGDDR